MCSMEGSCRHVLMHVNAVCAHFWRKHSPPLVRGEDAVKLLLALASRQAFE